MGRRCIAATGVALAIVGCGLWGKNPDSSPAPELTLAPSTEAVRVTLAWKAPVDLDLYVTDPAQETVYFANTPSGSGGRLARDFTCADLRSSANVNGVAIESAGWQNAAVGRYRVGVDFGSRCDSKVESVRFRVIAEHEGKREERVGELAAERFEPIVLEFETKTQAQR